MTQENPPKILAYKEGFSIMKQLRKLANVNQKEFSKMIGVSQQHISSIEIGFRQPTINIVIKMVSFANKLGYDLPLSEILKERNATEKLNKEDNI